MTYALIFHSLEELYKIIEHLGDSEGIVLVQMKWIPDEEGV